jgi:hypothetical protein
MTTRNIHHYPGVEWVRRLQGYRAFVNVAGTELHLGYYLDENVAYGARTHVKNALKRAGLDVGEPIEGNGRRWCR